MTKQVNSFGQGMDQDSSKKKYDNAHYYEANNVRIITQEGLGSGALEDIDGNIARLYMQNVNDIKIIGHCIIRDIIILFAYDSVTDYILRVPIEEIENKTDYNYYWVDYGYYHDNPAVNNLIYKGDMGFSEDFPIQAIGRYETESIQKIYWTDGNNKFRYLNIVYDEFTNDLETLPVDRLEVIGDIELTQPVIEEILIGGSIRAGRVQYLYQLYSLNGSETIFSPASNLISITGSSESQATSEFYHGSDIDDDTGKAVSGTIEVTSTGYTRIRIVAIHYSEFIGDPQIRVFDEKPISSAGETVTFIDNGLALEFTLTLEAIRLLQTTVFDAKVIETKDNILFAANVTVDDFDVEYDARAYRFGGEESDPDEPNYNEDPAVRRRSRIYEEDGTTYYSILATDLANVLKQPGAINIGDWENIPPDADCINNFNDIGKDGYHSHRFMYQKNGYTVGGEGPNVSYMFWTSDTYIDEITTIAEDTYVEQSGGNESGNLSYYGYDSPYNAMDRTGYQRDEVYRFGIVFFDEKGRSSFVKWIGDIRMPSMSTRNGAPLGSWQGDSFRIVNHDGAGERIIAHILYLDFKIENVPDGVSSYQIVRVKREINDRNIHAQGLMGISEQTGYPADLTAYYHKWNGVGGFPVNPGPGTFHSPEVSYNKNLVYKAGDIIQLVASYNGGSIVIDTDARTEYIKYLSFDPLIDPQEPIGDATGGEEFYSGNYHNATFGSVGRQTDSIVETLSMPNDAFVRDKGICYVTDMPDYAKTVGSEKVLINYRRNSFFVQYGGNSFNARTKSQYIAASPIVETAVTGGGSLYDTDVFNGDTFIVMFKSSYDSYQDGKGLPANPREEIMFPCESSINVPMDQENDLDDIGTTNDFLVHDVAGSYSDGGATVMVQEADLYIYNSVYSRENDLKIYLSKPFDWKAITDFDVRIYASDLKINGELTDSWLKFRTDSFIEVDPQYGPITVLKTVIERLLFFQPQAFGTLSVNERALLQTTDIAQLSLGVSGVLERYDYAKTDVGCYHWRHLILTANGLYWVDLINKAMYSYTSGIEELSIMKGLDSWFKNNVPETIDFTQTISDAMFMFYDPEYKEVYLVDNTVQFGLIFNELTQSYISFTDIIPTYAINYLDRVLSSKYDHNFFHRHNDFNAVRGSIYGDPYPISVTLLINPSPTDVAIYNNFEWLTEVADDLVANDGPLDLPLTFGELTLWNDYQHSGSTPIPLVVGGNIKRRMRKWRYTIPRATYAPNDLRNPEGLLPEKYARFRDSHLFVKFSYTNVTLDRTLTMHDIITSFTISNK